MIRKSVSRFGLGFVLAWSLASACATDNGGTDSNTHWVTCGTVADCPKYSAYRCMSGHCVSASTVDSGNSIEVDSGNSTETGGSAGDGGAAGSSPGDGSPADVSAAQGGGRDASPGSGGARDASVEFSQGDAGPAPPPYCVAPCVWEVVKHCIPTLDTCVTNHDAGPAFGGFDSVTCDPTTGWAEFSGVVGPKHSRFTVSRYGETCFQWDYGYAPIQAAGFSDRSGRTLAIVLGGNVVYCGATYADLANVVSNHALTDGGLVLADGGFARAYPLDRSQPECAAWQDNGLPVAPPCTVNHTGVCAQ